MSVTLPQESSSQKTPSASPWSWGGLRDKAWQALSLSAVLSVIAGIAHGAGYFGIVRQALTLGIPNPETSTSAYQHMGLSMLLDTVSMVGAGVASAPGAAIFAVLVMALCLAICLRSKSAALKSCVIIAGYAMLIAVVVRDGLQIWRSFDASNLLQRAPEALEQLKDLAERLFEAVRSGNAALIKQDYAGFAVSLLAVLCAAIVLGLLARNARGSLKWPGPLVGAQLVLATLVFGDVMLLAQLYGVVSLADSQRCVLVSYTQPPDVTRERSQLGWLMSDLAFSGDHVSVLKPDSDSWLYVIKRADVVSYRFFARDNCKSSMLPNAPAPGGGTQ